MTKPRQPRYADIYRHDEAMQAKAKEVWQGTVAWLIEHDIMTPRRVEIADRYARAYAEYSVLHPIVAEEGPVLTSDTTGNEYFNYRWSAVQKLEDRLAKFEDALLISPKSAQDKIADKKPEAKKTKADAYLD